VHDDTFGGLTPPITYLTGQPSPVPCFFVVQIKNGAFTEPNGTQPLCAPASS
jgi:branched-chain amino acid transport system substrate-binding protein